MQLDNLPAAQVAAAFDLRPRGGPELEPFPYVPLLDRHGRIPPFHLELLPLVVAVLQGWGATLLIIPPRDLALAQAQAQWARLAQGLTGDSAGQRGRDPHE